MKYQSYLEKVAEYASEDYSEIGEILNRFNTLDNTHKDLKEKARITEQNNEKKRAEFNQYTKERTNEILNFNKTRI